MRAILLTTFLLYSLCVYGQEHSLKSWDEEDVFKSRIPEHESYSPFDMLGEQKRYEGQPQNVFEISEEDYELEEKNTSQNPDSGKYHQYADMILINKITAKSMEIAIPVGSSEYFGNIEIILEKCWYNGDLYKPSHKMLLKVTQHKIDEDPKMIYHGWLISSNMPVCNMQDPSYEIIAMKCHDNSPKSK